MPCEPLTCPGCKQPIREHLSPKEVARALDASPRTVRRMLTLGALRGFQVGRQWRICPPSVPEYLDRCMERASA